MWGDLLPSGLLEVASAASIFLLGLVVRTVASGIRDYVTDRPFRQTWNRIIGDRRRLYIIFAVVPTEDEQGRITSVLTLPVATALWDMVKSLERAYSGLKLELYPASSFPYSKIDENLVIVGGPVHNELSELLQDLLSLPLKFSGYELLNSETGEAFRPAMAKNHVVRDFGSISIFPNPFNPSSTVCIAAGCKAHGTNAAIRALLKPCVSIYYREAKAKLGSQAIVQSHVASDFISMPEILRTYFVTGPALINQHPRGEEGNVDRGGLEGS